MDAGFARKLIEKPGESTTRQLFDKSHAGVFWVDWREADDDIVAMAAKAMGTSGLRGGWTDGKLIIEFRGRRTQVPLEGKPGQQDVTLEYLNRALHPDFDIRFVRASEGGDTLAFMALPAAAWRELEGAHGAAVARAFSLVDSRTPLFGGAEAASQAIQAQLAPIHFERVAFRVITRSKAKALLADAERSGAPIPVVEPIAGDLALTYFRDLRNSADTITEGDLRTYATNREQLRGYATKWTSKAWPELPGGSLRKLTRWHGTHGRIAASSFALFDNVWRRFAEEKGAIVAAFPHRELAIFASAVDREEVSWLVETIDCFAPSDEATLSRHIYAWGPQGWQVYEPRPEERSLRSSAAWLSAQRGNLRAQYDLARRYEFVTHYRLAVEWYHKAAEAAVTGPRTPGDMFDNGSASQCNLADKYEHGLGVSCDFERAVYWYRESAKLDNPVAMYSLGMMYRDGRGLTKDVAEARRWLGDSAQRGYEDAAVALRSLET